MPDISEGTTSVGGALSGTYMPLRLAKDIILHVWYSTEDCMQLLFHTGRANVDRQSVEPLVMLPEPMKGLAVASTAAGGAYVSCCASVSATSPSSPSPSASPP